MRKIFMKNLIILMSILICEAAMAQELTLGDLGIKKDQTQQNLDLQKKLEERKYYLGQHQNWGLISLGAVAATWLSAGESSLPPEHPFIAGFALTAYFTSAYMAWKAPEINQGQARGQIAWHKWLAWIHFPGMVAAPILGYLAAKKFEKGEGLDGAEKYHRDVGGVAAAALAISVLTVSFEF